MKINYLKAAYKSPSLELDTVSGFETICAVSTGVSTIGDVDYTDIGEI